MTFILLAAAAIIPGLLLMAYFHGRDVYPEPPRVLWTTFGLGIVIVVPVVAVAWPLDSLAETLGDPLLYGFASAFFGAAIPEEVFKFVVLYFYAARHMAFDEPMDGIVYGVAASLGFATLENVLYVADGGLGVAVMRAILSVPGHAFLGAIMGYYVGQAKFGAGPAAPLLRRALFIPIVLHGVYDWPLLAAERVDDPTASLSGCLVLLMVPVSFAIVIGEFVWATRLVKRLRQEQLGNQDLTEQVRMPARTYDHYVPDPLARASGSDVPPVTPGDEGMFVDLPTPLLRDALAVLPEESGVRPAPAGHGLGWLLTILGGLLACGGGLVTLFLAIGLALGDDMSSEDRLYGAAGGCMIGVLPFVVGLVFFVWGIRRLNKDSSDVSSSRESRSLTT